MDYRIIPCTDGDDEVIAEKLNAVTDSMIPTDDDIEDEFAVLKITGDDGNIIAGCNLIINCRRVADIDILWVDEKYRRQGIGSALIREAESIARDRGCLFMTLGTFDFQARPLYEKHGFSVCGIIENCPTEGHTHYDMIKSLDTPFEDCTASVPCGYEIACGDEDDAEFIDDRLVEYNWSQVPRMRDFEPIGSKIADGEEVKAGCFAGVNFWNIAFIEMLWVDEPCRNHGMGSALLADVEKTAKNLGASIILTDAREWNVDFFKKQGYTVYCVLENYPQGHRKYKMHKRI